MFKIMYSFMKKPYFFLQIKNLEKYEYLLNLICSYMYSFPFLCIASIMSQNKLILKKEKHINSLFCSER